MKLCCAGPSSLHAQPSLLVVLLFIGKLNFAQAGGLIFHFWIIAKKKMEGVICTDLHLSITFRCIGHINLQHAREMVNMVMTIYTEICPCGALYFYLGRPCYRRLTCMCVNHSIEKTGSGELYCPVHSPFELY